MNRVLAAGLLLLLLAPLAAAHTAAPPRSDYTRVLHDCEDDWFGDDSGLGSGRDGYDLHTLDVREAWSEALGHHVIFRTILNGEGSATITLSLKADGASKSYTWTGSGSSWTGTFASIKVDNSLNDGPRFALEGTVKRSTLGADVGDKLTEYRLSSTIDGDDGDAVPDDNTNAVQSCRNVYNPAGGFTLKGPVQYVEAAFGEQDVQVKAGQETFVTLDLKNKLRDAAQTVDVSISGDLELHEPESNQYVKSASFDLNKRGSGGDASFIHVAVGGDTPGKGTATVTITTSLGGRITETLDYEILAAGATTTTSDAPDEPDAPDEESPGLGLLALIGLLAVAARRRA